MRELGIARVKNSVNLICNLNLFVFLKIAYLAMII